MTPRLSPTLPIHCVATASLHHEQQLVGMALARMDVDTPEQAALSSQMEGRWLAIQDELDRRRFRYAECPGQVALWSRQD